MTNVKVERGDTLTLDLGLVEDFRSRCPEQFAAIVDCAAFVNWRRIAAGDPPILLLAFG